MKQKNSMALALGFVLASFGVSAGAAPGVAQEPIVLFSEDFENFTEQSATAVNLLTYTGKTPAGVKYTADPAWQMTARTCNGMISSFAMSSSDSASVSACNGNRTSWDRVRSLSQALALEASKANSNHAVAAYTQGGGAGAPGADKVLFQIAANTPITVLADTRFITTGVDTAAQSCGVSAPLLNFYLVIGGAETRLGTAPVSACQGTGATRVNRLTAAEAFPLSTTARSLGYIIRNANGSGAGNDFAFDNPKILDVTPHLDKAFADASVPLGTPTELVLTITNTTDLLAKNGWSFEEALPVGLRVNGAITSSCTGTTITPQTTAGVESVVVTNGRLAVGTTSCTITIPVMPLRTGEFVSEVDMSAELAFINPPLQTVVQVTDNADMRVTGNTLPTSVRAGEAITGVITCLNAGPSPAAAASCAITDLPADATTVCDPDDGRTLAMGESISCNVRYTAPSEGTVNATVIAETTTFEADKTNNRAPYRAAVTAVADMQVTGNTLPTSVRAGDTITGVITCVNAGPSAAESASCLISGLPGDVSTVCDPEAAVTLNVGEAISCQVSFTAPATGEVVATVIAATTTEESLDNNNTRAYVAGQSTIAPVPSLGGWALMLLAALMAGAVGRTAAVRRR